MTSSKGAGKFSKKLSAKSLLEDDEELAYFAVGRHGLALQIFSRRRRADSRFVIAAVLNDGMALQFASRDLRRDSDVV